MAFPATTSQINTFPLKFIVSGYFFFVTPTWNKTKIWTYYITVMLPGLNENTQEFNNGKIYKHPLQLSRLYIAVVLCVQKKFL